MCAQRLNLLILVWFLIHLLSIIPIQCKRHRRSLDQHYLHHQNRQISPTYSFNTLTFQNQTSRSFNLKKVDLSKPNINSTSDWHPISKVKLNSNFINNSVNSVTFPITRDWPQYLDNSSLTVLNKNTNIKEIMKRSTDLNNVPILSRNNVNAERELTFLKNVEVKNPKKLKEIDKWNKENLKILHRVKRSANNDFVRNSNEPEKKTLLNLDGPNILEDLESRENQNNSVHIRVKRDNPNKDNIVPNFKSTYLEDLAASFPKSEHELEQERLASNKVEEERLFKRSSDHENYDNIENSSDIELNENSERRDEISDSSNDKSTKFRDEENLAYQQENLNSDLEDRALKHRKKRNNYSKVHPESYSMKDNVARSVSQIANDYQKNKHQNLEDSSHDYANDDLQIPYQEDNKLTDSILSKMDYIVENGDYLEKKDQQNTQNYASKTRKDLGSNNLYSHEVLQPEQQNEANLNINIKSVKGEFENPEEIKDVSLEEESMRFPGKEVLIAALPDKKRMTRSRKHNKRKFKKKKPKKYNKKHKKKKGRKNRKSSSKLSKMQGSLNQMDKVVDDIQVESKAEKMDSTDGRSEVDIVDRAKRESADLKEELRGNKDEDKQCIRAANHYNQELKYYEKIREPETLNRNDAFESKVDRERRALTKGALKSVEEIKTLVDKLVAKVNDLHDFVGINLNKRGKKDTERKKNFNLRSSPKTSKRCMALEKQGNVTFEVTSKSNLNSEKAELLQKSRVENQKEKQFPERKKKYDSNHLVELRADKISSEIGERNRSRRKRRPHRKWDRWTDWSGCSVTCGKGRQIRWRHCIRDCRVAETEMEEKTCQLPACPPGKFLGIF